MPRYTITIADVDLFIHTEEAPEMVERLVATVDGRIREIAAKNLRLSKSEASILCAVDYCADKLKCEEKNEQLSERVAALTEELEVLKRDYANLSAEAEEIRRENRIINGIIAKNMAAAASINAKEAKDEAAPKAAPASQLAQGVQLAIDTEPAPASEVMFDSEPADEPQADVQAEQAEDETQKSRRGRKAGGGSGKNKVGDMFDLLTFKKI